jgi:peptide/nickel transport system permease protein
MTGSWSAFVSAVLRRFGIACVQVLVLLVLVFAVSPLPPGDAADGQNSDVSSAGQRTETRPPLGLDVAPATRFLAWFWHVLRGDFGRSYAGGTPVLPVITDRSW